MASCESAGRSNAILAQGLPARAAALPWSLTWKANWLGHAALAAGWLWLMPGGFPLWHGRFWANRAIPAVVIAIAAAGIIGAVKRNAALYQAAAFFFPMTWTASLLTAVVLFPVSSRRLLPLALFIVIVLWGFFVLGCRRQRPLRWSLLPVGLFSLMVGVGLPWTQRAADPDTTPRNASIPADELPRVGSASPVLLELGRDFAVRPSDGSVVARCRNLRIEIQPFLRFESVSPDRCWTLFAPGATPPGAGRRLNGLGTIGEAICLQYGGDLRSFLRSQAVEDDLSLDAFVELKRPIFSHLNTFCEITIDGHRAPALSFSPCPAACLEVLPADYPTGRPARHAYLAGDGSFHVVEARSGEKGPFRSLARGRMARHVALTITVHDEGRPICRMTFSDWAAQSGVALSPTAGWGMPVNAIEFQRLGDESNASVKIWMTLAATSVGRGWDSVGHRPGVYRNRIRLECLAK